MLNAGCIDFVVMLGVDAQHHSGDTIMVSQSLSRSTLYLIWIRVFLEFA
jgi:hypothetical protein